MSKQAKSTRADEAYDNLVMSRTNCSQGVLNSYAAEFGLERGLALRLALGFGGGIARGGNTCGAVTGASMVLGLSLKATAENPLQDREEAYAAIQEFNRRFIARHGTLVCRELLGLDLSRPEGLEEARRRQLFVTRCPDLVKSAVQILEDMLALPKKA